MFSKKCIKFPLVSKTDVNGIWKYLRWYANFNVNSKSKKGHNLSKCLNYFLLSTDWGPDGEQMCKVSKPYVNGLWKYLRCYKNINVNSKSKKGHNSVKMLDTVTPSCLQVGVMMVNKCAKFQSHMSMDFENIWGVTKTLT
jgi:Ni,Fe-hydrogenase I cytochrome b subunit